MKLTVRFNVSIEPSDNDGKSSYGSIYLTEMRTVEADNIEHAFTAVADAISSVIGGEHNDNS